MSTPFIFIGTHRIKPGKLDDYRKEFQGLVEFVEANEPRVIAFHIYVDEERDLVTGVQVHPDPASMEHHMKVVAEHIRGAYDYIETTESIQVYGEASEMLEKGIHQAAPPGTPLQLVRSHDAGFTRTNADA